PQASLNLDASRPFGQDAERPVAQDSDRPVGQESGPTSLNFAPAEPPPGARPLEAGDLAVLQNSDGTLTATAAGPSRVSCNGDSLIKVETQGSTLFIGIPTAVGWDCPTAVQRWRSVSPPEKPVGVRYSPG